MRHKTLMILSFVSLLIACKNNTEEKSENITISETHDGIFNIDVEESYGNTKSSVQLSSYAVFNFGKYKMDPEITLIPPPEGLKMMESINKYLNIFRLKETVNEFFITFCHGIKTDSIRLGIFNKSSRELVFLEHEEAGRYGMVNDLDGGLSFWPRYVDNDSIMVDYLDAYEIVEYYESQSGNASMKPSFHDMARNRNINDNPVLVVTKTR